MRLFRIASVAFAASLAVTPRALAQTPQTPAKSPDTTKQAQTQTFTGCLMTEPDYRRAHKLGAGQVGGVGLGDEFVLVDVKVSPAKGAAGQAQPSQPSNAAGTASASKCADKGVAYRLTGGPEDKIKIKQLVGHQLEVQGRFKHSADAAAGGTRPGEKLPAEVEIVSFIESPSPAAVSEPAPMKPAPATPPQTRPAQTPPPTPATVEPARDPAAAPATPERRLPRTAGSVGLVALIGFVALSSGVALKLLRRLL